jgi:hypothetical protein
VAATVRWEERKLRRDNRATLELAHLWITTAYGRLETHDNGHMIGETAFHPLGHRSYLDRAKRFERGRREDEEVEVRWQFRLSLGAVCVFAPTTSVGLRAYGTHA